MTVAMESRLHPGQQGGYTLVEVMVAAMVLVVGLLGALGLLTGALKTTQVSNARVAATNLARELAEAARTADYDDLSPTGVAAAIQAQGFGGGSPWQVTRRGVTYQVTATACVYDDPADRLASPAPAGVCTPQPSQPAGTTVDQNGDDFRRITFTLQWRDRNSASRTLTQTALIVNPSGGLGPRITNISPLTQTITLNSATFADIAVATTNAATVRWHADDGRGEGNATGGPTSWNIRWQLGVTGSLTEVLDGTYSVIAQPSDTRGIAGDSKLATVVLNRRQPYRPSNFAGGHNTRVSDWVDFDWLLNAERDILGYRVYWSGPNGNPDSIDDRRVCPPLTAGADAMLGSATRSCTDTAPGTSGSTSYYVVALDKNPSGALREGDRSIIAISGAGSRPDKPTNLTASTVNNQTTLTWTLPSTTARYFRIYRDGTQIGLVDRYDRTASGTATSWSDSDSGTGSHTYWVTTVGTNYNESDPAGPVSWP